MTRTHENSLRTYLLTRIALAVPTVLILLTMVFLLIHLVPGDPAQAMLGENKELGGRRFVFPWAGDGDGAVANRI